MIESLHYDCYQIVLLLSYRIHLKENIFLFDETTAKLVAFNYSLISSVLKQRLAFKEVSIKASKFIDEIT